jgi:hypothetical protein
VTDRASIATNLGLSLFSRTLTTSAGVVNISLAF